MADDRRLFFNVDWWLLAAVLILTAIGVATILSATPGGDLTIRLDHDDATTTLPAAYITDGHLTHAYAMTGIMCTAAAVLLPGTIPNEVASRDAGPNVRIGHPRGVAEAAVQLGQASGSPNVEKVSMTRTARRIMSGEILYPSVLGVPAGSPSVG